MKKIALIFAILFLQSCKKNDEVELLKHQNEILKKEIESRKVETKKYMVAVIYNKRGNFVINPSNYTSGFEGPIKNYINYSDIIETNDASETSKYKALDELENKTRRKFTNSIHSITKRECKVFDTYIDASEYLRSIRDLK